MKVTNSVRDLRYRDGYLTMTQQALADRVGVSRQTINAIERHKHPASLEVAFKISDAFDRSIEDVFHYVSDVDDDQGPWETLTIVVSWDDDDP